MPRYSFGRNKVSRERLEAVGLEEETMDKQIPLPEQVVVEGIKYAAGSIEVRNDVAYLTTGIVNGPTTSLRLQFLKKMSDAVAGQTTKKTIPARWLMIQTSFGVRR